MRGPGWLLRAVRRPRVRWYRPRGWVADLLDQSPQIAASNVLSDYGDIDPDQLSAAEADALTCARYVIEVPASRWDHERVHPVKRRRPRAKAVTS